MASMLSLALLQKKVPDGDLRNSRGAKKGGYTDHIAGPHLIPNVGREAMVPAECVKRKPRPVRKEPPKAPPPIVPQMLLKQLKKKPKDEKGERHKDHAKERRRRSRSRSSRSGSRSRRRSSSSSSDDERRPTEEPKRAKSPDAAAKRRAEEEQQRQRQRDIEAYREAERNRQDQERMKLEAFKEAQMQRRELDMVRKKRLSGAFALDEDDIPEEDTEGAPPKSSILSVRSGGEATAGSVRALPYAGGSGSQGPATLRIGEGEKVTAADLDGSQHDHKFSAVWKDWNAQKRDDPGEIAKQFMKIAAIKRRGFDPMSRGDRRR